MKRFDDIPLHINILSTFLVLLITLSCAIILYNYKQNSAAALEAADRLLGEITEKITERTSLVFEPAFVLADEATLLPDLSEKPDLYGHPSAPLLMNVLAGNKSLLSAYMGYEDGDFLFISHLSGLCEASLKNMAAPPGAHFSIQTILHRTDGRRVRITKFLDKDMRIMGSRMEKDVTYDPRLRPWYTLAVVTDRTVLTDLYVYSSTKEVGLTVARRFDGRMPGVFGVDIALSGMSRFLARQKIGGAGNIFIFHRDGTLMAYPDQSRVVKTVNEFQGTMVKNAHIRDLKDPVLDAFYQRFTDNGGGPIARMIFKADGREYIVRAEAMPERYGAGQFLAILVPLEEFTGPITRAGTDSMLVSLLLMALFVPVIIFVSRRISQPIRLLAEEAERIRTFDLASPLNVVSRITEIKHLVRATGAMKSTLASFGVYVPKALVRKIISRNETPHLGGERRELTLLFSDIANFTTLSEDMHAEDLAHKVSLYFERLGGTILDNGGTIDKFIGDAIMAFWNAPVPMDDHECRACLAALRCLEQSRRLDADWEAQDEAPMPTRFGLHSGETVVGNIGSSDRMDYTAMGAAVNLASRLEGLNKHFGTSILVSETVAGRCADRFLFRTVGRVVPKGALTPVAVFELKGLRCDQCADEPGISASARDEAYCMRWEKAFALYLERRWIEAIEAFSALTRDNGGDTVADVYLARARAYAENPPGEHWTGVEIFDSK